MKKQDIDFLIKTAIFSSEEKAKKNARTQIKKIALKQGIFPASLHLLYKAFGQGKVRGFTVPAINIRTLTYDIAKTIFRIAKKNKVGAFIFEIARSEISYTNQRPEEYSTAVLAAAIYEDWQGPVFIQGDHYQFKVSSYKENPDQELQKIKDLVKESIKADFYNIDIDASTLVDLEKTDLDLQQKENYKVTAVLTSFIRKIQPKKITVSIGGEIGHIGGKNSTPEEFEAFMNGYLSQIKKDNLEGISKVSVQTGTSHGGIPLPDGTIAKVSLDFDVLKKIAKIAKNKYKIGGPVQHGASTLPETLFDQFPKTNTLEIHLATGFQNIVYDNLPQDLKKEIYFWIKENLKDEWKKGATEEQFIYKSRKKALGLFKQKIWDLSKEEEKPILNALEKQFEFLFRKLNIFNTQEIVNQYV